MKKMKVDVENIIECKVCGLFLEKQDEKDAYELRCPRCDTRLKLKDEHSVDSLLYAISSLMLFGLINVFPLIDLSFVGIHLQTTLIDSVITLFDSNIFLVAIIVFFTIVLMPLLNSLIIIVAFIQSRTRLRLFTKTLLYDGLHFTKSWTFMEVFILSIVVTYIKLIGMVSSTRFDVGFYILILYSVCFYMSNRKFESKSVFGE